MSDEDRSFSSSLILFGLEPSQSRFKGWYRMPKRADVTERPIDRSTSARGFASRNTLRPPRGCFRHSERIHPRSTTVQSRTKCGLIRPAAQTS